MGENSGEFPKQNGQVDLIQDSVDEQEYTGTINYSKLNIIKYEYLTL